MFILLRVEFRLSGSDHTTTRTDTRLHLLILQSSDFLSGCAKHQQPSRTFRNIREGILSFAPYTLYPEPSTSSSESAQHHRQAHGVAAHRHVRRAGRAEH
jgi:hypothetical protein